MRIHGILKKLKNIIKRIPFILLLEWEMDIYKKYKMVKGLKIILNY